MVPFLLPFPQLHAQSLSCLWAHPSRSARGSNPGPEPHSHPASMAVLPDAHCCCWFSWEALGSNLPRQTEGWLLHSWILRNSTKRIKCMLYLGGCVMSMQVTQGEHAGPPWKSAQFTGENSLEGAEFFLPGMWGCQEGKSGDLWPGLKVVYDSQLEVGKRGEGAMQTQSRQRKLPEPETLRTWKSQPLRIASTLVQLTTELSRHFSNYEIFSQFQI